MTMDVNNKPLSIGDKVYFTKYGSDEIKKGSIEKINQDNIFIRFKNWQGSKLCRMGHHRAQYRIVKI